MCGVNDVWDHNHVVSRLHPSFSSIVASELSRDCCHGVTCVHLAWVTHQVWCEAEKSQTQFGMSFLKPTNILVCCAGSPSDFPRTLSHRGRPFRPLAARLVQDRRRSSGSAVCRAQVSTCGGRGSGGLLPSLSCTADALRRVRWQAHPLASVMTAVVGHIRKVQPTAFLLENVMGLADKREDEELSALDVLVNDLRAAGYCVSAVCLSPERFINMSRERTLSHRQHSPARWHSQGPLRQTVFLVR
jgi:hypothetical protein